MTVVTGCSADCENNNEGICTLDEVSITEDFECAQFIEAGSLDSEDENSDED